LAVRKKRNVSPIMVKVLRKEKIPRRIHTLVPARRKGKDPLPAARQLQTRERTITADKSVRQASEKSKDRVD